MTEYATTPRPEPALLTAPTWPLGSANSPEHHEPARRVLAHPGQPTTTGNTILRVGTHIATSDSELWDSTDILLTPAEREELIAALTAQRDTVRTRIDAACAAYVGHTELSPAERITATLLRTWPAAYRTAIVLYAKGWWPRQHRP